MQAKEAEQRLQKACRLAYMAKMRLERAAEVKEYAEELRATISNVIKKAEKQVQIHSLTLPLIGRQRNK